MTQLDQLESEVELRLARQQPIITQMVQLTQQCWGSHTETLRNYLEAVAIYTRCKRDLWRKHRTDLRLYHLRSTGHARERRELEMLKVREHIRQMEKNELRDLSAQELKALRREAAHFRFV